MIINRFRDMEFKEELYVNSYTDTCLSQPCE